MMQSTSNTPTAMKMSSAGNVFDMPQQVWQQNSPNVTAPNASTVQVSSPARPAQSETREYYFALHLLKHAGI